MSLPSPSSPRAEGAAHALVLHNKLEALETLSEWVNQLAAQLGISAKGTFRLDLALTEAVTNVIQHAYADEQPHSIHITLEYQRPSLTVRVIDDGRPFNPLKNPAALLPKNLEDAGVGGLGIHLIRNYTDACTYQRHGERNILTMILHDQPAPQE